MLFAWWIISKIVITFNVLVINIPHVYPDNNQAKVRGKLLILMVYYKLCCKLLPHKNKMYTPRKNLQRVKCQKHQQAPVDEWQDNNCCLFCFIFVAVLCILIVVTIKILSFYMLCLFLFQEEDNFLGLNILGKTFTFTSKGFYKIWAEHTI